MKAKRHLHKLDNIFINTLINPTFIVVVLDVSIKNNIVTSILYIHSYTNCIRKTIHYTINITITETKSFTIKCRINQAINIPKIFHIIAIADFFHLAKQIFDLLIHPYELQLIAIIRDVKLGL